MTFSAISVSGLGVLLLDLLGIVGDQAREDQHARGGDPLSMRLPREVGGAVRVRMPIGRLQGGQRKGRPAAAPFIVRVTDRTSGLEIHGRFSAAFSLNFIADLLALIEALQAGTFDRTDMDEHVLAAAVGLNEAKPFCGVEPLNRS